MKNKKIIFLTVGISVGIIVVFGLLTVFRFNTPQKNIDEVSVIKDGNNLTVKSDGSVSYVTSNGTYSDYWGTEKTSAFLNYFGDNYLGENDIIRPGQNVVTVVINGVTYTYVLQDDEIVDAASDDATDPDQAEEENDDGDDEINQYFSPTPFPTSNTNPTPTPTPYNGGGSPFSECLFWRLSYCVIPKTPTPSPTATPSEVQIKQPDCTDNLETGRTVITNELCLPTPTPTVTPQ